MSQVCPDVVPPPGPEAGHSGLGEEGSSSFPHPTFSALRSSPLPPSLSFLLLTLSLPFLSVLPGLQHGRGQDGGGQRRLAEALPFAGDPAVPIPPAGQQDKGAAG